MNRFVRRMNRFYENWGEDRPALIVYSRNRLYFSDTTRPGILLMTPGSRVMFGTRATQQAREEARVDEFVEVPSTSEALEDVRSRLDGPSRVGLERRVIPASMEEWILGELRRDEALDLSEAVQRTRIRKDSFELDCLREAVRQSNGAHRRVREELRPGIEELDLAAGVESAARSRGHEGILVHRRFDAYLPYGIITSGENLSEMGTYAYVSHGTGPTRAFPVSAGHRTIQENDPVVVDIGGVHYGYNADVSRTYVAGTEPDDRIREAHEALGEVYRSIERRLRAGSTPEAVYRAGLEAARQTPFGEYFQGYEENRRGRFVGHGVGLEIDEPPLLAPGRDRPLPINAAVTVEIAFVFPRGGAVKIEESCVVRDDEPEILSDVPRRLFTVETT